MVHKIVNQIKNNSKTKNRKIDYSFVSEHCASFWTKKLFFLRGGGGVARKELGNIQDTSFSNLKKCTGPADEFLQHKCGNNREMKKNNNLEKYMKVQLTSFSYIL